MRTFYSLLSIVLIGGLFGCGQASNDAGPDTSATNGDTRSYPYKVTATVGMVADIVRQVAGDKAEVQNIIGEGVDPHLYSPTRSDIAALMDADIVFYSGLLLEGKMTDVLMKTGRKRPVYAVTEEIPEEYLLDYGDYNDPHVWMDVNAWMKAVEVVREALSEFDPDNADHYAANADAYLAELEKLDAYCEKILDTVPKDRRVLITAHDAFQYFSRAYGLEVEGIQGLSTESEAGLKRIEELVEMIVEREIKAVFIESTISAKNVRALIEGAEKRGHELTIGGELFSDAMGQPGTYEGTYIGMIDHNATTIARALGGEAPARGMQGKLGGE